MNNDARERFTLRIPTTLMKILQNESKNIGVSINALVLQILWEWAEKNNQAE